MKCDRTRRVLHLAAGSALLVALHADWAWGDTLASPAKSEPAGSGAEVSEADLEARPSLDVVLRYAIRHNPGTRREAPVQSWDRCLPSTIAFGSRDAAQQFQTAHGGEIQTFTELVEGTAVVAGK